MREIVERLMENHRLTEMAIINPQLCKQSSIQVEVEQRDEGPIPHLHVYLDKSRNKKNCAYIRLDKAEYSTHHKGIRTGKWLDNNQKEEFMKIMTTIWNKSFIQSIKSDTVRKATGYEAAVQTWIDTFGETVEFKYDEDGFPVMPDYENLL